MSRIRLLLLMSLLALFSGACSKKSQNDQTAVLATSGEVRTLDPARAYDGDSMVSLSHTYERLYTYDKESKVYRMIPQLAESMPVISKDGKTTTITIRKGILFQNDPCFKETAGKGRELTAADFVYGMKRLGHPQVEAGGRWLFEGKIEGFDEFVKKLAALPKDQVAAAFEKEQISGIQATGPYTLQIKAIKPLPQLIYFLAMHFTAPVPHEAVIAYGDEKAQLTEHPVGTGPFRLQKWERGKAIYLVRNENYKATGEGRPEVGFMGLEFRVFKDELPQWLEFLKGNLTDILVPSDQLGKSVDAKKNEAIGELKKMGANLHAIQGLDFYWLNMNVRDPFLANKKVRQAISSALNREKWLDLFQGGAGSKQTAVLPPGLPERDPNAVLKYDYNVERAKQLLAEAGFPEGKGAPTLSFMVSATDSKSRQFCDFIAQELGKIGLKIKYDLTSMNIFMERMNKKDHQLSYWSWRIDYPDAENVFQLLSGKNLAPGMNYSNFVHPEFDSLFQKLAYMQPSPERKAIAAKMDSIVQEEVPWALGIYVTSFVAVNGRLKNFSRHPFVMDTFRAARF